MAGSTIRGRTTSGRLSRAPWTASRIDSVPPDVTVPTAEAGSVEQAAGEADELVLHLQQRRERRRVERVGGGVGRDRLPGDPVDLGVAGVVDVGQRAASVHRQVPALQGGEPLDRVGHWTAPSAAATSAGSRVYWRSHHRLTTVRTAGTIEKPSAIVVSAESGWLMSRPSLDR